MVDPRISAFVITCDQKPRILNAVLKRAKFVDELVLVDKGREASRAATLVSQFVRAPWSPTVEPTRILALDACSHDWIVCLDDDEILSARCESVFRDFVEANTADVLFIPIKNYVLGRHDPTACYWPEFRPVLFRRGTVTFHPTVHRGVIVEGRRAGEGNLDTPAFITHLSHPDIHTWLEKTNRYTDQLDRASNKLDTNGLDYNGVVARLIALYHEIDLLKRWEQEQGLDGNLTFARICQEILRHD